MQKARVLPVGVINTGPSGPRRLGGRSRNVSPRVGADERRSRADSAGFDILGRVSNRRRFPSGTERRASLNASVAGKQLRATTARAKTRIEASGNPSSGFYGYFITRSNSTNMCLRDCTLADETYRDVASSKLYTAGRGCANAIRRAKRESPGRISSVSLVLTNLQCP